MTDPVSFPKPPTRPEEDMCCGRGCVPCIFDYYETALERWSDKVRAAGGDPDAILRAEAAKAAP